FFFFQAEDGIRDRNVTGVQTCALPISRLLSERRRASRTPDRTLRLRAVRYGIWNRRASCEPRTRTSPGAGSLLGTGYTSTWDPRSEERRVGKEGRTRWGRWY